MKFFYPATRADAQVLAMMEGTPVLGTALKMTGRIVAVVILVACCGLLIAAWAALLLLGLLQLLV